MKISRFFEVPDDIEARIRLLFAGPAGWIFSIYLKAPEDLVKAGEVSLGSRFYYDGNIHRQLEFSGSQEQRREGSEDFVGIIAERKFPQFISFSDLGLHRASLRRTQGEQIAAALMRKGFTGRFKLHSGYYRDYVGEHAGSYDVELNPWDCAPAYDERGRARINWDADYGGNSELVAPLVGVCEDLGLREYTPAGYKEEARAA